MKNELVAHKRELVKSKLLDEDSRKYAGRVCVEQDKLNNKSTHVDARHDTLVKKLKNKLYSVIFEQKEEEHVEAKDTKK